MNDFTNFSDNEPQEGEAPLLDEDFDAPAKGSIEEAAMKIDAILGLGRHAPEGAAEDGDETGSFDDPAYERGEDTEGETTEGEEGLDESKEAAEAKADDPMIDVEIDGEAATVPLSELTDAWSKSGDVEVETTALKESRKEIDTTFEAANAQLKTMVPALRRLFLGEFADAQSPEQLRAMAAADPARFAEYQTRSHALKQAEGFADVMSKYERGRVLETGSAELTRLIPELGDAEGGEALREDIRAYGVTQGFDDERIAEAGAEEIVILHKAMKYDQLEKGQVKAARRAKNGKRARPVMTPGHARRDDPAAGYRQAMARLKKTGHVDDAAKVIEMML
jgi:hypothetical protein